MARSNKRLVGYWHTENGERVWVYKGGRSYWISQGDSEHLCHPSIRSIQDTRRETVLVFHVSPTDFQSVD